MNPLSKLALFLVAGLPLAALAQPAPPPEGGWMPPHARHGFAPPPFAHAAMPLPHGLSEAQQDKLFAIAHAEAPAWREHMKTLHKTGTELQRLAAAEPYDEAAVRTAAETFGRAVATMQVLRAEGTRQRLAVLTPEQRRQTLAAMQEHKLPRGFPPPPATFADRQRERQLPRDCVPRSPREPQQ